jgi:osmotically-inducible protein OsmY
MKIRMQAIGTAVWLGTVTTCLFTSGCAGDRTHRSTGEQIDDRATSMRVKSALGDDTQYKYPLVEVKTFKGVAQLSGFVSTREQKSRAGDIAKRVEGVHSVENDITVKE